MGKMIVTKKTSIPGNKKRYGVIGFPVDLRRRENRFPFEDLGNVEAEVFPVFRFDITLTYLPPGFELV